MKYLVPDETFWAVDIEGDNLPSNVVWCLCAVNVRTGEEISLTNTEEIRAWVSEKIEEGHSFVAHNGLGYDFPTLNRLIGTRFTLSNTLDSMLMSMLFSPSLDGGHSLAAWGDRLRFPKYEFNDFSQLTPEMVEYCLQDARLCRKVYISLVKKMVQAKFSETGIELEHRSWQLIQKQKKNGFHFNIQEAHVFYARLRNRENEIRDEILTYWPPTLECVRHFKQSRKKDGSFTKGYLEHLEQYEKLEITDDGGYDAFAYVSFHVGSPQQRVEKLLELGWVPGPDERTETGNPKPTDKGKLVPTLVRFVETSGRPEPALIAKWMEVNARANMINTWIEAYNDDTNAIHGSLWLANTLRYKHSSPNTANIPAVRVGGDGRPLFGDSGAYTYEARDLWDTRDKLNRRLVGVDAKGIQLRVLAHYLNNPAFTEAVLDGDPHSYNQEIGGFATRAISKTFIYAYLLGAGDAKVGTIIGGSTRDGKEIKSRFTNNFPGLQELLQRLEREIERTGRIRLCDGTPIIVKQPHTRLGYLLQGDESRIMKKAAININREIVRNRWDALKVCDVHDEFQFDVLLEHVDPFCEMLPTAFRQAGEFFNYRIPIDCSTNVGLTWSTTH